MLTAFRYFWTLTKIMPGENERTPEDGAGPKPQDDGKVPGEEVEEQDNPEPYHQELPRLSNKQALVLLKAWLKENQYKLTV